MRGKFCAKPPQRITPDFHVLVSSTAPYGELNIFWELTHINSGRTFLVGSDLMYVAATGYETAENALVLEIVQSKPTFGAKRMVLP